MTGLIAQRINQIRQQIPSRVRLIAVTKQVSVEAIREAYEAGIRDFAENRIQEALPKQKQLEDLPDICWHFIGHLQANKAQKALEHFEWIHSVDSLKLARRLDRLADSLPSKPKVCLQVKILSDPKKYGFSVSELLAALSELERCDRLNIRGLMTILPLGLSRSETLAAFQATRSLAEKIKQQNLSNLVFEELSMGMSADYLLAIEAGATIIRLGRIIFGERQGKI
ncbi:MAG: YggS family pyridoxal phosphate-dependent enzyme [Prochloraceae cyanobacterium]|nr:YggS family pyridoxal phosphate-dependent enzyme [Prochloraceae cyanobacterium]